MAPARITARALRRGAWGLGLAVGIGLGAAACEPVVLDLVVDSGADLPDATPGDGICATNVGTCTLRAAIDETNATPGLDRITIAPGLGTVTLGRAGVGDDANLAGDLDIDDDLRLVGNGTTIEQTTADRVLHVLDGDVRITNLVITGGERLSYPDSRGGGIAVSAGTVELGATTITGNHARKGGGVALLGGELTITATTIRDNIASARPGIDPNADGAGGGIHVAAGALVIDRTSVHGNEATGGAGLGIRGGSAGIDRSTISRNVVAAITEECAPSPPPDGPITCTRVGYAYGGGAIDAVAGSVLMRSSTLHGGVRGAHLVTAAATVFDGVDDAPVNAGGSLLDGGCDRPVVSAGYNVGRTASCLDGTVPTDAVAVYPGLGPLVGGMHRPADDADVIDAIPPGTPGLCDATVPMDQAGSPRPLGGGCDVGAVEGGDGHTLAPLALVVTRADDLADAVPGDGVCRALGGGCTLRAAVDEANAAPTHDTVTIMDGIDPRLQAYAAPEAANATGDLDVTGHLTIVGGGAVIDATAVRLPGYTDQAISVSAGRLELRGVTLLASWVHGGIDARNSALVVEASTLDGGSPSGDTSGQALVARRSHVSIRSSTITGGGAGNLVRLDSSTASVVGSTIANPAGIALTTLRFTVPRDPIVRLHGSILWAGSGPRTCHGPGYTSLGHNLDGDGTCLAVPGPGDQPGVDPLLGPLTDNGGLTPTRLPWVGSPAIDAVALGTPGLCDGALPADQRGEARPAGVACDVGAVEQAAPGAEPGVPADEVPATGPGSVPERPLTTEPDVVRLPGGGTAAGTATRALSALRR